MQAQQPPVPFTGYQKFVIFVLAITQFTVILDFMVMSPLGDMLMKSLSLQPRAFGIAVSAYAFSAGISGLLTAGFADRFDRKKLLLFFYCGFIVGTVFCGMAHSYVALVAARIITGLFGGVIGSVSMAIITDIFSLQQRGRVMGFIQMGFGASQVLGIPIALYLANLFRWEAPFWMVAAIGTAAVTAIAIYLKPITAHLAIQKDKSALLHLWHTAAKRDYQVGFAATALLSIGGFMMMPFGTAFAVNNLKIPNADLFKLFMVSGLSTLVIMPVVGKLSDRIDKFKIFMAASVWTMIMCVVYTNLGPTPLWLVMILNVLMMMGVMSRMVPSSALTSAIPDMADRGAFMSINSSLQQIAGGIAAVVAGMIVTKKTNYSPLVHYDVVGYVIVVISVLSILGMLRVDKLTKKKMASKNVVMPEAEAVLSEGM
ncbi:MFS transporter [Mucilaginibacter psychrotolerans]|uniref:MFS transporter n=1 Tax=Mucilaginibacter psychrotolerans TaxID=1524096 RepID=A0A4Y8S883_9SPHI|nr:MFS transporter [Mucilaginibacter psychrotolerans]TFF34825.1 MFS transporter [Mucilaginibacter psychrotolerans]